MYNKTIVASCRDNGEMCNKAIRKSIRITRGIYNV